MANWLRIILSVFVLAGLLATGAGGAMAAETHSCCPHISSPVASSAQMTMMGAHHGDANDHADQNCCVASQCVASQPNSPTHAMAYFPRALAGISRPARDDATIPSLPVSPDLRPPIA